MKRHIFKYPTFTKRCSVTYKLIRILPIVFSVLTIFAFKSCNPKSGGKATEHAACKPYFQFDAVDHYFIEIDESNLWTMKDKKRKSEKETLQLELLVRETLQNLSDTTVLNNLEKLRFVKRQIEASKFGQLTDIFCEQKHKEALATTCIPVYRDIFFLKIATGQPGRRKFVLIVLKA